MNERDPTVALRLLIEETIVDELHKALSQADERLVRDWAVGMAMRILQRMADDDLAVVRR